MHCPTCAFRESCSAMFPGGSMVSCVCTHARVVLKPRLEICLADVVPSDGHGGEMSRWVIHRPRPRIDLHQSSHNVRACACSIARAASLRRRDLDSMVPAYHQPRRTRSATACRESHSSEVRLDLWNDLCHAICMHVAVDPHLPTWQEHSG